MRTFLASQGEDSPSSPMLLDPPLPDTTTSENEEVTIITAITTEDDLDLPEVDDAQEAEFVFIQRNFGDVAPKQKAKEPPKLKYAEHVDGPPIHFENSQRVWGAWFTSLIRDGKDPKLAQERISKAILRPFGVLATCSGENLGSRGKSIIEKTVGSVLRSSSPALSDITHNRKWIMIECTSEDQRKVLLARKIVYNSKDMVYVTFRKPTVGANLYRWLEIRGLGSQEQWEQIKARFKSEGAIVKKTIPIVFLPDYTERVNWLITFPKADYAHPETVTLKSEFSEHHIAIHDAMICRFCAASGHHFTSCSYGKARKVNLEAVSKQPRDNTKTDKDKDGKEAGTSIPQAAGTSTPQTNEPGPSKTRA
jgi:hypothetical protein